MQAHDGVAKAIGILHLKNLPTFRGALFQIDLTLAAINKRHQNAHVAGVGFRGGRGYRFSQAGSPFCSGTIRMVSVHNGGLH